ncbi:MAG: DUF6495 family protein [Vicingaceae bacterium]
MKYRYLTFKELAVMQEDFTNFLYTEGFSRFDWRVLQDQHSDQAVNLLARYSDKTFDKVMDSVQYLEYRSNKELRTYQCKSDELVLIGLQAPSHSAIDFTQIDSLYYLESKDLMGYRCFKEVKPYQSEREKHVFNMIESGHYVVNEENFNYLKSLRLMNQN